jgi:hypothetical protein
MSNTSPSNGTAPATASTDTLSSIRSTIAGGAPSRAASSTR